MTDAVLAEPDASNLPLHTVVDPPVGRVRPDSGGGMVLAP